MPRLTCPNCDTNFETAGARYTSCPACGSRLDTRGPDGLRSLGGPSRAGEKLGGRSPFDASDDLAEIPKSKLKTAPRQRTVIIRTGSNSDSAPKAMLAILVGTTVLGCLLVGVIVTLIWYLGERPQVSVIAAAKPPSPSSDAGGSSWNGSGNQPQPVFGPGIFAGNNPRQVAVPTPRGTLPGIDPTEFPGSGTEIGGGAANIQDILDLLPPGFFGPEGPGAGGMPGPAPGSPIPPAAAVLVTLSNLRIDGNRIQVDFDYGNGIGLPFDRYVIRAGDGVTVIRPLGLSRGRGTMTSTLQGVVPPGPVQVWLERRASPQADGERISNILSR